MNTWRKYLPTRLRATWSEEDLLRRVVDAACALTARDLRGDLQLPHTVAVTAHVATAPVETVRRWSTATGFRDELYARLRNRLGRHSRLPTVVLGIEPAEHDDVVASELDRVETCALVVEASAPGGALHWQRRTHAVPRERALTLVGRGRWHGPDSGLANDVVLPDEARFVSRAAFELRPFGDDLHLTPTAASLPYVRVVDPHGILRIPVELDGTIRVRAGDIIQLVGDASDELLRITYASPKEV